MSMRSKVMGCLLLVLALFAGVTLYNYARSRQTNQRLALVNNLFLPLSRQLAQLQANIHSLGDDMRRYYFSTTGQIDSVGVTRLTRDLYPYLIQKKIHGIERLLGSSQVSSQVITELMEKLGSIRSHFEKLSVSTEKTGFESELASLRESLQFMIHRVEEECQAITMAAQVEGKDSLVASTSLSLLVAILGAIALFLSYRVLRPLPLLISSIRKLQDGDLDQSLKVQTHAKDEVSLLAREFNRMLAALRERDRQIRKQQTDLLQSEKLAAIGQLSAEVVHEIRNPLNSMSLNIDWLANELNDPSPEIKKTVEAIAKEISRLNQITESYLVRSRVNVTDEAKAPINQLIKEIIDFDRDQALSIDVKTELWPEEIYIRADRSRIKQAFINVIKNAREAMPRGGILKVRTELKENTSQIIFSDTGSGMNDATKRQSFSPFFTTKTSGTGLGLALTRQVVEESNGVVHCDSEVGRGTTFTFQFPIFN